MKIEKQLKVLSIIGKSYFIDSDIITNKFGNVVFNFALPSGYIQCRLLIDGKIVIVYKHILIYLYNNGCYPENRVIAHKDLNNTNNKPENLIATTQSNNVLMSSKPRAGIRRKVLSYQEINSIINLSKLGNSDLSISNQLGINRTVVRYHTKVSKHKYTPVL